MLFLYSTHHSFDVVFEHLFDEWPSPHLDENDIGTGTRSVSVPSWVSRECLKHCVWQIVGAQQTPFEKGRDDWVGGWRSVEPRFSCFCGGKTPHHCTFSPAPATSEGSNASAPSHPRTHLLLYIYVHMCIYKSHVYNLHPTGCEVISHCNFDLHLPNGEWCWASSHVSIGHLYVFFGDRSMQIPCPFFNGVACHFIVEL